MESMDRVPRCAAILAASLLLISLTDAEIISARILTENHVNEVDSKFVSFTIDPKYLFTSSEKSKGKESVCMAAALTPAYLRIAGPSTLHMIFHNTSISIDEQEINLPESTKHKRHLNNQEEELDEESHESLLSKLKRSNSKLLAKRNLESDNEEGALDDGSDESLLSKLKKSSHGRLLTKLKRSQADSDEAPIKRLRRSGVKDNLKVSHKQWKRFFKWAKDTGFDLVFAVNNGEKTENGMWDPNPALNMLTMADKDEVEDIFWQLGYECTNQTIEDYLNDLQTLRMMVDTFGDRRWKVVGGDVTNCLEEESKSDFRDYVTLTSEMMDAVMLNGNSSSRELLRMSPSSRLALLKALSTSSTPLWLTESPQILSELARAADWITSLGYSAKNGFNVHYRELVESELYEPTLSFYMALLFKNLVGERVLDITTDSIESNTALFAHCTSLRHKPVPGAVTLYAVNMDSEPARLSVKLGKREEGGDIMQFILGHDHNGNIVVNGRAMYYEGDIRPVVKRVRPFKTLLLNLPPKTFGFWVLANTKVNACFDYDDKDNVTLVEAKPVNYTDTENLNKTDIDESIEEKKRTRRSVDLNDIAVSSDAFKSNSVNNNNAALRKRIDSLNKGLRNMQVVSGNGKLSSHRVKRQLFDEDLENRRKLKRKELKKFRNDHKLLGSEIFEKLRNSINSSKLNLTKNLKDLKLRKPLRNNKNKLSKRNSRNFRNNVDYSQEHDKDEYLSRRRRSVFTNKKYRNLLEDTTSENEIGLEDKKPLIKFGKFFNKQEEIKDSIEKHDKSNADDIDDGIEIKTKLTNDDAVFQISENADHGLLKNTFENVLSLLEELNDNLSKLWNALSFFD